MAPSATFRCPDCGREIPAEDVTRSDAAHSSTGRGERSRVRLSGRRQPVNRCPDCAAKRKRWEGRIKGLGGLLGTATVVYMALRASGVL